MSSKLDFSLLVAISAIDFSISLGGSCLHSWFILPKQEIALILFGLFQTLPTGCLSRFGSLGEQGPEKALSMASILAPCIRHLSTPYKPAFQNCRDYRIAVCFLSLLFESRTCDLVPNKSHGIELRINVSSANYTTLIHRISAPGPWPHGCFPPCMHCRPRGHNAKPRQFTSAKPWRTLKGYKDAAPRSIIAMICNPF